MEAALGFRTPCPGVNAGRTPKGHFVIRLHYSADPTLTPEAIEEIRRKQPSEAHWRKEYEIEPYALQGSLVYPSFDEKAHVLPDEQVVYVDPVKRIKRRGTLYMALDPHPRTPHAGIWVLIDRWSDWYVYRDMWPSAAYGQSWNIRDENADDPWMVWQYADAIAQQEGNAIDWRNAETDREYGKYKKLPLGEDICERYMDQAGKGFYDKGENRSMWNAYYEYGIECTEPYKVHKPGEDAIRALLEPRKHSLLGTWPRLHIAASCRELILEFKRHRYKKMRRINDEKDIHQDGVEARTHLLDCLRYLATAEIGYSARKESSIYVGTT